MLKWPGKTEMYLGLNLRIKDEGQRKPNGTEIRVRGGRGMTRDWNLGSVENISGLALRVVGTDMEKEVK